MNETDEFRGERLKVKWLYVLFLFLTLFLLISASATRKTVKEGNYYSDKENVALYLYTYKNCLIIIFLTKKRQTGKQIVNNRAAENIIIKNIIIEVQLRTMPNKTAYRA